MERDEIWKEQKLLKRRRKELAETEEEDENDTGNVLFIWGERKQELRWVVIYGQRLYLDSFYYSLSP